MTLEDRPDTILGKEAKKTPRNAPPRRQPNAATRTREHLLPDEVERLLKAVRGNRNPARDHALILLMFRRALRVSEAIRLKWSDVDLPNERIYVRRLKNGVPSTQPLSGIELRALKQLRRRHPNSSWVFLSERGAPMTRRNAHSIVARAGKNAKLGFPVHPHQLRHALGFYMSEKGVPTRSLAAYMGHKNLNNSAIYAALSSTHFNDWWSD
jgi:type 1 fimbriae regulatory protein FimB/type 1 fimbriae regulatory protein FimE